MSQPVIELEGLEVRLAGRQVLTDLRVSLSARSIGLLGPNGAGKTTLLHTLLGFHSPARGSARVLGLDVQSRRREVRELTGYMPENESFVPGLSAVRLVRMMAELSGLPPAAALERAHEALFTVGLGEARYRKVETFSLGMKQRVKLAQAIAHAPKLLLLDEPTNGLDPPSRLRMIRLIQDIRASGEVHLVLSSHLLRDVEECCEQVLVLKEGRVAVCCDLEEERRANRRLLELETRGDDGSFVEAVGRLGCEYAVEGGRRIKVVLPDRVEIADLYRLASERRVQLRRVSARTDSLEEIFFKAMGESGGGR